jgi:hypothetical protein
MISRRPTFNPATSALRGLWSLLVCLALVLSPLWQSLGETVASLPQPCKHCNCGGTNCCVDQAPQTPAPSPAQPVSASSLAKELGLFAAVLSLALPKPGEANPRLPDRSPLPPASCVPLHVRNCTFLI